MGILSKIRVLGLRRIACIAVSIYKHGFTLLALLDAVKNQNPNNTYIADDHDWVSYDHLYKQSLVLARHLHEQYSIGSKSRVAIVSANSIEFLRSLFAVSGLGADIFLLNPNQKEEYFRTVFEKHKITLIIATAASTDDFREHRIPFYALDTTVSTTAKSGLPNAIRWKKGRLVILSSGSGGQPTIERRKISVMQFLNPITYIISKLHLKENKSVLISVPVFHGYGLAALFLSFFLGQKIRLTGKFDAGKTRQILKEDEINCWIAVPLMIQKVLAAGDLGSTLVKSIISGGDVLPSSVVETIHNTTKIRLYNMYGTSETGVCTIASDEDLRKYPDTIGKTITGVKTMIHDAKGNFATTGGTGRLFVKCGWSSDTRSNAFIATGDLVSANEEGYYFFKGRQDDLMVIGGENVYPIEIENVIYKHPGIRWVKAKRITDSHDVTKIHVDLVIHPESAFDQNQFLDWISTQVPNYMIPKTVAILSEQPVLKLM